MCVNIIYCYYLSNCSPLNKYCINYFINYFYVRLKTFRLQKFVSFKDSKRITFATNHNQSPQALLWWYKFSRIEHWCSWIWARSRNTKYLTHLDEAVNYGSKVLLFTCPLNMSILFKIVQLQYLSVHLHQQILPQ